MIKIMKDYKAKELIKEILKVNERIKIHLKLITCKECLNLNTCENCIIFRRSS